MTEKHTTRRDCLRKFGGLSIAGIAPRTNSRRNDTPIHDDVRAADLLIPESAAPVGFETSAEPNKAPLIEQLQGSDTPFADADVAGRGFWAGRDEENPHWVLSCLAIVCDQLVARQTVETAGSQVYDEFVAEYDAETPSYIDFEQSLSQHATMTDWRMEMVRPDPFSDTPASSPEVLFTDVMRLQYHENVLLGTVVFGPDASNRDVETMLTRYARLQRSRLRTHTDS